MSLSPAVILYDSSGNQLRSTDLDTGAGTDKVLGVNLRRSANGGSVELGTDSNPIITEPVVGGNPQYTELSPNSYQAAAFGDMRVAAPYTLLDTNFKYDLEHHEWESAVVGGGVVSHLPNESAAKLAVTTANADRARLRTITFFRYQAGKGHRVKMTCVQADTGQANQTRRWGYFDDNDGLFFELTGTSLYVVRRTSTSGSPVDTQVAKASWSYDPMDGTGPSGVTLDVTKGNIYEFNFQWLGVGKVRVFVNGFLVHVFDNANTYTVPYIKTAVLPVQGEIINTGASTASYFKIICSSVISEGGMAPPEYTFGAYNTADISVTTTERPLLSIRPAATHNSITNRILLVPKLLIVSSESQRAGYRVVINTSLTGASYAAADADSAAEYDISATAFSGGKTVLRGMIPVGEAKEIYLDSFFHYLGRVLRRSAFDATSDILTVLALNEGAGNTNMRASLTWGEAH
jgi:hypothetical protein